MYLATEVFKSLTDKKDRKLLAVLRVIADRRPEQVLEVLKLYKPLDTPQLFVANGKHYQPTKSHVLTRLRLLNKPRSDFDQQPTTSPVQSVVGNSEVSLLEEEPPSRMCQLVVDLSMVTVLVARRKSSQNLTSLL